MYVLGIAGGSGSGKTTLASNIFDQLTVKDQHNHVVILSCDNYYKDLSHLMIEDRKQNNYDHPDSIEWSLLKEHIMLLKEGKSVSTPVYNFATHTRKGYSHIVDPCDILILDGILLFYDNAIVDMLDYKIFVDCESDERFMRRMLRDINERGRDIDSVVSQYRSTVKPMYLEYVDATKKKADYILINNYNTTGLSDIAVIPNMIPFIVAHDEPLPPSSAALL